MTTSPAPRYIGSQTTCHGEVLAVHPCGCGTCRDLPEWEHLHATLQVLRDDTGRVVTLRNVRFESFTGRPA